MKIEHFEAFSPICPRCLVSREQEEAVAITLVDQGDDDEVVGGLLRCTAPVCGQEYPIVDGVPFLVPDPREYVKANFDEVTRRDDLTPAMRNVIGECAPDNGAFEIGRQHLSTWCWGHYADLDRGEPSKEPLASIVGVLDQALEKVGAWGPGLAIDCGCAVGRTTFEIAARSDDLVLGVDLNYSLLRTAQHVRRTGVVRYPRRRQGLVYDWREFPVELPGRARADFWLADAMALPVPRDRLALATSLNLLDAVRSPHLHLANLGRVLLPDAPAVVATPYDWSPAVTPVEGWFGGHHPHLEHQGRSEFVLRAILTPGAHATSTVGLRWADEIPSVQWIVRIHERSVVRYKPHVVIARASG